MKETLKMDDLSLEPEMYLWKGFWLFFLAVLMFGMLG